LRNCCEKEYATILNLGFKKTKAPVKVTFEMMRCLF
jgi:hypothetical protein